MKKSITIIIGIIVAIACLSSCSQKTCPTYSYKPKQDKSAISCASTKTGKFDKTFKY